MGLFSKASDKELERFVANAETDIRHYERLTTARSGGQHHTGTGRPTGHSARPNPTEQEKRP